MDEMTIIQAVILGIVEGITEYLPISSTGHLIITASLLGLDSPPERKAAVDAFNIVIQGGAILAVLTLYWPRVMQMIKGLLGKDPVGLKLAINILIAFIPAAILGVLLDDYIEAHLFFPIPVLIALGLGGLLMIGLGPWQRRRFGDAFAKDDENAKDRFIDMEDLPWQRALIIGLLQCVAMIPGTSRSMMTIVGGMLVGLRPKEAAEFSFLLGLPTLGGACVYKGAKNLMGDGPDMIEVLGPTALIVGFITATIAAALAVKWLVGFLSRHGVAAFGWYRLALCAVMAILIWQGVVEFGAATGAG